MSFPTEQAVRFGPYRIYPDQRRVLEGDQPLRLGRRALDILLVLLEHAGSVVSKQVLLARVWPTSVVEEINLRVHMAALRKALGDGQAGQRYIITIAQRGYSFVAPIALEHAEPAPAPTLPSPSRHNLPLRRTRMIGRQPLVDSLMAQLARQRLVTLVGPGGIGKTTVALRVAEQLLDRYRDGIRLLDLSPITDPALIAGHLAALFEWSLDDDDALGSLSNLLHGQHLLLVIDNCEHLIDSVAMLCEQLLRAAPQVHILATSRESLRAEGEFVQRLDALDCPPPSSAPDCDEALGFSALQLFVERAMVSHEGFELNDAALPQVIEICRRLDGIPLAIELAAAQVGQLGLDGLLVRLLGSFRLNGPGDSSSQGRHQTLRATLDWSFELLNSCEQTCLRRLAVFRGGFTLESAAAVIVGQHIAPGEVLGSITQLVAKSLLTVEVGDEEVFYRLLDTTRRYALEKLRDAVELAETLDRHAERCLALMHQAQNDWPHTATRTWIERYSRSLEDLRAALDRGLGANGPHGLAIRLTAVSTPLWQELSLLKEHGNYVRRALALLLASAAPCPRLTINLKLALGSSCYHSQGGSAETVEAFVSAKALADEHLDTAGQLRAVSGHMAVNLSCGRYQEALAQSLEFDRLVMHGDALVALSTHRLRVLALHFAGQQTLARSNAEQVLQRMAQSGHLNRFTHGFGVQYDQSVAALTILARILWLQGQPQRAWLTARQALDIALQINHGTSICYTLALAGCLIAHYNGDAPTARELLRLLLEQSQKHSVPLFQLWARHYAQVIDPEAEHPAPTHGSGLVRDVMVTLDPRRVDYVLLARAEDGSAGWSSAEIFRAEAERVLSHNPTQAEALLQRSLAVARQQGARAWELRSATSLARVWQSQGNAPQAFALLAPVYAGFTEGLATPDVLAAQQVLEPLHGQRRA
ncbi:winged helix-turn-helix domain-containing protein [Pseudomonas sp. SZMC_28357]|uniref:ATP-binding protein n=1 Tax=Pseudomonas sp. SZMC_28357 TaxID=3074380 RepID=UPI002871EF58|nr:winged helix-turn-helix domain-containing protein [Pseudomonas sp. SZMC_28357]MDR9752369.1 winged helix-turn-helix domain-containing protein [Pseudomonas sp. SZMC_28357]